MNPSIFPILYKFYRENQRAFLIFILLLLPGMIPLDLEAAIKKYDETVSLGSICQPAWHLKANEMRSETYPFDWFVTPFHGLISFIENRGANFFDKDKIVMLEVLPASHGTPSMLHVQDLVYDIHSIHDFLGPDMPNYESVKAKYDRRIKRFFDLLESNKKILFIRVQISRQEAEHLNHLLHALYPRLEYTLVAVSDDPDAQFDWGLKRVRNFYMKQISGEWVGDGVKWKEILSQFPLKEDKKKRSVEEQW